MTAISEFLEYYPDKIRTVRAYRAALVDFLSFIYKVKKAGRTTTPEELARYEELSDQYLADVKSGKRDAAGDIVKYLKNMNGTPAKTKSLRAAAVKTFLMRNKIRIEAWESADIKKSVSKTKVRKKTEYITIEKEHILSLLSHFDVRMKAITLFMASSGCRIGEALTITKGDIDLTITPARVHVREEIAKNGQARDTFISDEARGAITEWLKVRDQFIRRAKGRHFKRDGIDPRFFAIDYTTVYDQWETALKKAGFYERDQVTNRSKINPHGLRRFFRTHMGLKAKVDAVEAMLGHEGYLTEEYRDLTIDQLADEYIKGMGAVTIAEVDPETRGKVDRLAEENRQLRQQLEEINKNVEKLIEEKLLAVVQTLRADNPISVTS